MSAERERFFSHVIKGTSTGACWIWTGAISNDGYGIFWRKHPATGADAPMRAHRYALSLIGPADPSLHALHKCDNTLCVRATTDDDTHLVYGTRSDNMTDRARRQRGRTINAAGKEDRAAAARTLRRLTLADGYSQQAVDQLMKGIHPDQATLF